MLLYSFSSADYPAFAVSLWYSFWFCEGELSYLAVAALPGKASESGCVVGPQLPCALL